MAAMAVIGPCHRRSLRAAHHALLFQPAYLTGGKQIRDLAQVDLRWRTVVEYGERIGALAVAASRRRHVSGIFSRYGTAWHVFRAAQIIAAAALGIDQCLVCEQELSHSLLCILAFVDVRVVLQRQVFKCFFNTLGRSIRIDAQHSVVISKPFHCSSRYWRRDPPAFTRWEEAPPARMGCGEDQWRSLASWSCAFRTISVCFFLFYWFLPLPG